MTNSTTLYGKDLVDRAIISAQSKKGKSIVVLNPGKESTVSDWFLICEGENTLHTRAIAEAIIGDLKKRHNSPWHIEGIEDSRWILIDYSDVVISILVPELREYYKLESLWGACPREDIEDIKEDF